MWCVTWPKVGSGRNRQLFKNKAEAKAFFDLKKIELENFGRAGMELTDRERNLFHECRKALEPFGKSLRDAVVFFVEHLKVTSKSCTAADLVCELLKAKESDGASETHLRDIRRLNKFAEKFNGKTVAAITSAEIDDWLRSIDGSPVTRNKYRALTLLAFNFAVRRKYVATNPAIGAAKAKVVKSDAGILTVEQAEALLKASCDALRPYIAIGLFAGLRRAELERLDWSEIDFERGLIKVGAEKSKTATRRLVTMEPNLREWLLPLRKHKGNVTAQGKSFRHQFDAARKAAAILDNWPDNALRHSFASYHMAHFQNAAKTALECGHDQRVTFAHYRELVKPADAERYWQIMPEV